MSSSSTGPLADSNDDQHSATGIKRLTDRRVLTDRVYDILRAAILSSELKPGASLIERELAGRFGVSKSPVRDALQRLAGEGLVVQSSYRGMTVITLGARQADEIFELREVLEPLAVRQAVPVMREEDFAAARTALDGASSAISNGDVRLAIDANRRFHDIFITRCSNQLLEHTLSRLHDQIFLVSTFGWSERALHEQGAHRSILQAAETRDQELTARMMAAHIQKARQYLRDFYKTTTDLTLER